MSSVSRRDFKEYKRAERRVRKLERRALKLQAREYERRLKGLNGEHKRMSEYVEQTVRQEAFEDYKRLIDERVGALRRAEDQRTGGMILVRVLATSGAVGLLLSILNSIGVRFGG